MGIAIFNGTGTSGLSIQENSVTDCKTGIRLGQYSPGALGDMTTVAVTGNTLTDNTTGLQINDGINVLASNFTIQENSFSGNTTGLHNQHSTQAVTAEKNWWGDATGPQNAGNPHSTPLGDPVTGDVDFKPWGSYR
ncbi:MAG: hypothetical protein ACYS21_20260 [Planctomycetota bacterium]|jgi:hypothetical protein